MKILIIDDDSDERALTVNAVAGRFPDAEIVEADSREAYARCIVRTDFDLVITEYRLGWTDGLAVFNEIHSRSPCIPVIMLTGSGSETVAVDAIKAGMGDYIAKSHRHLLLDAIEKSLRKAAKNNHCKELDNILLCEKWELAISRLTSDFAYSMRITPENRPVFEWVTEPFKRMIRVKDQTTGDSLEQGNDFGLIIHPDDEAIVKHRFERLLAGYEDTSEYRIITAEGGTCWVSDHALPIRDWQKGQVVRIYGAIQDITWQRQVEDKLRLMQRAIDSSNNGIIITGLADTDHAIIYANEAFLNMTGYSLDEVLGQNCRILQKDDRDQPDLEKLRIALNTFCDGYAVLRNYRKDGSLFWNEVYVSPVRDKQGKITHFIGVQNDVTRRCEMENLLSKSEAKLRAILDNVLDGIIIVDDQGIVESLNPSCEKMFGYRAEELVGQNIKVLIPEQEKSRHDSNVANYIMDARSKIIGVGREAKGIRKNGSIFSIDLGISEINIDHRRLFIGTIHDVTERKEIEQALRELSGHLASAREEERTRISREIHDELGPILTTLKMDLSWLNKQFPADFSKGQEKARTMSRHIDDAIRTVRKIITELRPSILDHLGLLAAIDWQMEQFKQQTGIHCAVECPDTDIAIDEHRSTAVFRIMQQALNNIAMHAKATQVLLKLEWFDNNLTMTITDNGRGMTKAQMNKPGRYGIQGMRERAQHYGGKIIVNSRPGRGTALILRMPLH